MITLQELDFDLPPERIAAVVEESVVFEYVVD